MQVLVHGGAGHTRSTVRQRTCLTESLAIGMACLKRGGSALDAVETMIRLLEGSGLFNAGLGSLRQLDGRKRMDAALMEGCQLQAGAVAGLEGIQHPISAARVVMDHTAHVLLVGKHAARLARHFKLARAAWKADSKVFKIKAKTKDPRQAKTLKLFRSMMEYDTVGAVARDAMGTIAAGTSTGGVPMMLPGRVGDSPLIGCGVFADNTAGGVSMTGIGETIIRMALAKHITMLMKTGKSPRVAAQLALRELVGRIKGEAGVLVLGSEGKFSIQHTTPWMSAGHWTGRGKPTVRDRFIMEKS